MANKDTQVDLGGIDPITNAIGMIYNIGSGIANQVQNARNDKWNKQFAREQFDYQKSLNERLMEREDNAVRRRAYDLEQAGLSKTLAAGDAAQSSVAGISPLGNQANANKTFQQLGKAEIANSYAQYYMTKANADARNKEGELIDEKQNTEKALQDMYDSQANLNKSQEAINWHNYDYAQFWEMPTGLSARASNKYELLSSFGQFLIKSMADSGTGKDFDNAIKRYEKKLDEQGIAGEDKKKLMNQFYKNASAMQGDKDIDGNWIW